MLISNTGFDRDPDDRNTCTGRDASRVWGSSSPPKPPTFGDIIDRIEYI